MIALTHHAISSNTIVALIVALVAAVIVGYVLRAVGAPEPVGWLVALLVFLVLFFA